MTDRSFFEIVNDPDVFDFEDFNLFKLFYTRYVFGRQLAGPDTVWKPKTRTHPLRLLLARATSLVRSTASVIRAGAASRRRPRILFYGPSGRLARDGCTTYDLYNARVVGEHGREHFTIVEDIDDGSDKTYRPDFAFSDFALVIRLLTVLVRLSWGPRLRRFAGRVRAAYPALGFSQAESVQIVSTFYANYLVNRLLVAILAPERALFTCHYGREPFIAACKRQHVPVTELMHGAIPAGHRFYCYPASYRPLFARALFPDRIATYGEFWCRILVAGNMFPPDSVVVAGYYLKVAPAPRERTARSVTRILICTQPTVQGEMLTYIAFLKSALERTAWEIVIKPHPREDAAAYQRLSEPGFVTVSDRTTYQLLAECDIHISAYSSVLYEAILYGASNYSLRVDRYARLCDEVVGSGVALSLRPDELPVAGVRGASDARFYLDDYHPDVLFGR
jgi:hypothetical protein